MMKRAPLAIIMLAFASMCLSQTRTVQNRPYTDLRPLHFGISLGVHLQDVEFNNVGPQIVTLEDGSEQQRLVLCDADTWNPGFSVGILADLRLNNYFSFRVTPTMHFGGKHLTFLDIDNTNEKGEPTTNTQILKNIYLSIPVDIKFSAPRYNNYRPYLITGIDPMINLTHKDEDIIQLKNYDMYFEIGFGCDFYLRFFKFITELKFCYSIIDAFDKNHIKELNTIDQRTYAGSVCEASTRMFVLTFYFE